MIHYTCDVCGATLPDEYERRKNPDCELARICKLNDICPDCKKKASRMDIPGLLLEIWRKKPKEVPSIPAAPAGTDNPAGTTEVLREKDTRKMVDQSRRALILNVSERLRAYHKANGLGSLEHIAAKLKRSKVTSMELRDAINGQAADLTDNQWRRIAEALDALEGKNAG